MALGVVLAAAVSASAAPGDAALSRDHAGPNGDVTVIASGFKPNSSVDLYIEGAVPTTHTEAVFGNPHNADAQGAVNQTFRTPTSAGTYRIALVGLDANDKPRRTSAVLTVQSIPCENTCNTLPRTGAPIPPIWLGFLVLGVGALAVYLGRHVPIGKHSLLAVVLVGAVAAVVTGAGAAPKAFAATTASITGHVQDANGDAALSDVCVHATSGTNFASALTDAQGNYTLSNLNPGTYTLNYLDCHALDTYLGATSAPVDVADAAAVTAPVQKLTQGGNLQGRVTDATSHAGIDLVCVRLASSAAPDTFGSCAFGTGPSGVFFPAPIAAGTYSLAFQDLAGGHAIRYSGNANDAASDTPFTLARGQLVDPMNVELPVGATATGHVVDDTTNAAPTDELCVVDISHDVATLASSFVGEDGTFEITNIAPGDHKFRFGDCEFVGSDDTQYVTQYFSQKATVAAADVVPLTAAQDKTGVDARMSKTGVPTGSTTTTAPGATTTTTAPGATTTTSPSTTSTTASAGATTTTTTSSTPTRLTPTGAAAVSTSSAPIGGAVTVSGSGFRPGSTVQAAIFSTPKFIGSATANSAGAVSISFLVPAGLELGTHEIQLQGVNAAGGSHVLSATITVRAGTLSRTGSDVGDLVPYALGLLALGAGLFTVTYRRRAGSHFAR